MDRGPCSDRGLQPVTTLNLRFSRSEGAAGEAGKGGCDKVAEHCEKLATGPLLPPPLEDSSRNLIGAWPRGRIEAFDEADWSGKAFTAEPSKLIKMKAVLHEEGINPLEASLQSFFQPLGRSLLGLPELDSSGRVVTRVMKAPNITIGGAEVMA